MKSRSFVTRLASIGLALGIAACAKQDAAWVHENLALTENFHAGTMVLETPRIPDTGKHKATLRATARSRGRRIGADVELVVRAQFSDFSFLDRASFASGRAYPLTVEKREGVDCGTTDRSLCDVWEHVSIKLSRDFLKARRANGFFVKLWGRRDSAVIQVPPEYIEGLLARMENRAPQTTTAATPAPSTPDSTGSVPAAPAPNGR